MGVVTGSFLICIGIGACNLATSEHCSIALGDHVQLPKGTAGSHVLATKDGVHSLYKIDDKIIRLMVAEIERVREEDESVKESLPQPITGFGPDYIDQWNRSCGKGQR